MAMLEEIKGASEKELTPFADRIRERIIDTVSKNGGHLASNLGIVEATIALHYVFDSPNDKIIFDVGHQAYAHKIITGREEEFSTLRQLGGISGFTNRQESEHDILNEGHSGTSISQALGIAEANKLKGDNSYVVAVIGDGSLTNGMVYEALNNCVDKELNLIILINDNEMSISKNVGGLHKYFSKIRTSKRYFGVKKSFKGLRKIPLIGKGLARFFGWIKNCFKRAFVKKNFFECLGLKYIGPVDGNNISKMIAVLNEAKTKISPCVVHMTTKKGLGYKLAEEHPENYHSTGRFDVEKGNVPSGGESFSAFVGNTLTELAREDKQICAITAAMCDGTGLTSFANEHKERFYDVGIAEEHAITFASGLSRNGMKPVVALYSTFAQRAYDQILHDLAIQKLPLTLLLDRAGLVPDDGITHQGIFDYPIFSSIPNTRIYSPETFDEVRESLKVALSDEYIDIIRYPKGNMLSYEMPCNMVKDEEEMLYYSENIDTCKGVIITYGKITKLASEVLSTLKSEGYGIIKLHKIFPLNYKKISELTRGASLIYVLEESYLEGGVGQKLASALCGKRVVVHAIEGFVEHGKVDELYALCGFTKENIIKRIKDAE